MPNGPGLVFGKTQGPKQRNQWHILNYFELRWTAGLFWKNLGSLLKDGRAVSDGVDVASTCAHVVVHSWFTLVDQ